MSGSSGTIRFEDLGAPVQKLLRSLHGDLSEEDMTLLHYVSVKDMAKIFNELGVNREAELIWNELRETLMDRKIKAEKMKNNNNNKNQVDEEEQEEQRTVLLHTEETNRHTIKKEERKKCKELYDLYRKQLEELEEAIALEQQIAEDEKQKRRQRRLEEKQRAAAEEEERLKKEQEAEEEERLLKEKELKKQREEKEKKKKKAAMTADTSSSNNNKKKKNKKNSSDDDDDSDSNKNNTKKNQKDEWEQYVQNHPLAFPDGSDANKLIEQKQFSRINIKPDVPSVAMSSSSTPSSGIDVMKRICTPKCHTCRARFAKIPSEWYCPLCLHRLQVQSRCWQNDSEVKQCQVCQSAVGRFSRHHCRNCGRVVCGPCSPYKASIPSLGFTDPVKVCSECYDMGNSNNNNTTSSTTPATSTTQGK